MVGAAVEGAAAAVAGAAWAGGVNVRCQVLANLRKRMGKMKRKATLQRNARKSRSDTLKKSQRGTLHSANVKRES